MTYATEWVEAHEEDPEDKFSHFWLWDEEGNVHDALHKNTTCFVCPLFGTQRYEFRDGSAIVDYDDGGWEYGVHRERMDAAKEAIRDFNEKEDYPEDFPDDPEEAQFIPLHYPPFMNDTEWTQPKSSYPYMSEDDKERFMRKFLMDLSGVVGKTYQDHCQTTFGRCDGWMHLRQAMTHLEATRPVTMANVGIGISLLHQASMHFSLAAENV